MRLASRFACTALTSALLTGSAMAGLLDSPAPDFGAEGRGLVVYRMGPIHYEPGGWVDTTVTCTNLSAAPTPVGLEIFDERDQLAGQLARASVPAGAGVTFVTSADAGVAGAVIVQNLPPIDHGKARISALTKEMSCTAINRMRATDGSVKEAALELMKKVAY
jgi:hypothetical protein